MYDIAAALNWSTKCKLASVITQFTPDRPAVSVDLPSSYLHHSAWGRTGMANCCFICTRLNWVESLLECFTLVSNRLLSFFDLLAPIYEFTFVYVTRTCDMKRCVNYTWPKCACYCVPVVGVRVMGGIHGCENGQFGLRRQSTVDRQLNLRSISIAKSKISLSVLVLNYTRVCSSSYQQYTG